MKRSESTSGRERRLAFVLGENGFGGSELQAKLLIRSLREEGVYVHVFLVDGRGGVDGIFADALTVLGRGRQHGLAGAVQYARTTWRLRHELRRGDFAAVHAALARGYVVTSIAAVGLRNIRVVAWRRNTGVHLAGMPRLGRWVERLSILMTDVVVANSADVMEYWTAMVSRSKSRSKFVVVPNMLEDWRFEAPLERVRVGSVPRVVALGGLKPVKGHQIAIDAIAALRERGELMELVILGEGQERSALRRRAEEMGVELQLPGFVEDPRGWLHSADVFVHPSLSEGSSNAVAEAMAAGCAVVATDVGGMRELVGSAAILVPPADALRLADAVLLLVRNSETRSAFSAEGRTRMRRRSSQKAIVTEYLKIYRMELPCAAS